MPFLGFLAVVRGGTLVLLMNIHFGVVYLPLVSLFHLIPKNPTSITLVFVILIAY